MNLSDWESHLRSAEVSPDGFTTRDLMREFGICESAARKRLRHAFDVGKIIRAGFRTEENMAGGTYRAPVYQFVRKENGPQKATTAFHSSAKTRRR